MMNRKWLIKGFQQGQEAGQRVEQREREREKEEGLEERHGTWGGSSERREGGLGGARKGSGGRQVGRVESSLSLSLLSMPSV